MDPFVGFTFMELDASDPRKARVVKKEDRRERVDMVARQFHDVLTARDPADTSPQGMVLTPDFKIQGQVTSKSGWLTFLVDEGTVAEPSLKEVATVYFARDDDRELFKRLEPYIHAVELPRPPVVVAVQFAPKVPRIVREWYGKAVAAFFAA